MLLVGGLIVILTFVLIVKKYEARLVLFLAGLLMCLIGGLPGDVMKAFTKAMVNNSLVPTICTVMGFSYVMRLTTCDQHLVQSISGILKRGRAILVPISFFLTWWISLAIPSASGCSAAVGSILIPTLIAAGVHPAMAAATVLAGTWGSAISPGNAHNPFVADLAGTDMMTVIINETPASVIASIACVVVMTAYAVLRKEGATEERRLAYLKEIGEEGVKEESFHVRPLLAIVPLVPLFLLILGSKQVGLLPEISVPLSMLIGVALGFLVTLKDAQEICRKFFEGMGNAYADVIGLIVCASVFTTGMTAIGLTGALTELMEGSQAAAAAAGSSSLSSRVPVMRRPLPSTAPSRRLRSSLACPSWTSARSRRSRARWAARCRRLLAPPSSVPASPRLTRSRCRSAMPCLAWPLPLC